MLVITFKGLVADQGTEGSILLVHLSLGWAAAMHGCNNQSLDLPGKCRKFSLPLPLLLLLSQVLPSYTLCPKMSYSALYFHHSVVVPVSVLVEISEDKHETANNCIITRVEVIGTSDGNEEVASEVKVEAFLSHNQGVALPILPIPFEPMEADWVTGPWPRPMGSLSAFIPHPCEPRTLGLEPLLRVIAMHTLVSPGVSTTCTRLLLTPQCSERPVMYSGSGASAWGHFRLPHQMMDFSGELRRAMQRHANSET
ncbi:hypothetical protein CK203_000085 [Vitis vinifera]|uniref:Uncharacterized protein n=1 Tax=Vitis vinifera TaxID=29760 RepID=A0A438KPF0_VITVI|nr:hypothetical protein CK203_000085 [Vitis vinifera]